MTPTEHRPTLRSRPTGVCGSTALGLLLAGLLTLVSASSAPAFTFPYTFTPITGSPFTEQYFPQHVLFSPNGGLLATDSVYGFTVQPVSTTGHVSAPGTSENALTCPSKGNPAAHNTSDSIAISPDGKVIAEVEELGTRKGTLRTYSVSTSGSLTPKQCLTDIGNAPQGEIPGGGIYSDAFSPAAEGGLLAVTDADENKLWVFTVTGAGKVHLLKGFPVYTGKVPRSVAFSPGGSSFDFLAIANAGENTVSMFTVGSGVVAPVPGSPFAIGTSPTSVAFSPGGALLATGDPGANEASMFSVSFIGKLTQVSGSPFATGYVPASVAFSPDGTLLAAADSRNAIGNPGDELSLFSVSSAGALTPLSSSPLKTGSAPESVAFSPDGFLLASANAFGNTTSVFSYGLSVAVPLPPWLSQAISGILPALGLGSEEGGIKGLIGQALEEIHWGTSLKTATVHLVSKGTLPGREVGGACVRATAGSIQDPRCLRTVNVPILTLVAHSVIQKVRVLRRHTLRPGSHAIVVTATAPGVGSTPQALQVNTVG